MINIDFTQNQAHKTNKKMNASWKLNENDKPAATQCSPGQNDKQNHNVQLGIQ